MSPNLVIIPGKKAWLLHLDVTILSDAGNVYDVIFMAVRAALWDTKVPRTRSIQYTSGKPARSADEAVHEDGTNAGISSFDTRQHAAATDFELVDTSDDGEPLDGKDRWPVCVTLNIVSQNLLFPSFAR